MSQRPSLPGVDELFGDSVGAVRVGRRDGGAPADVADDLRDPLRALHGFVALLDEEQGGRLDADGRRMLQQIRSISNDLLALVEEAEDVAVADDVASADDEVVLRSRERHDLRDLVDEVVAERRPAAEAEQVTITLRPGVRPAVAVIDVARVRRILDDLLSVAVAASPTQVGADVVTSIAVTSRDLLVSVAFERGTDGGVDPSRTNPAEGERLIDPRLAVARHLARVHDGDLEVASLTGGGTTLTLRLPRQT